MNLANRRRSLRRRPPLADERRAARSARPGLGRPRGAALGSGAGPAVRYQPISFPLVHGERVNAAFNDRGNRLFVGMRPRNIASPRTTRLQGALAQRLGAKAPRTTSRRRTTKLAREAFSCLWVNTCTCRCRPTTATPHSWSLGSAPNRSAPEPALVRLGVGLPQWGLA
jgi:hypothetical protein